MNVEKTMTLEQRREFVKTSLLTSDEIDDPISIVALNSETNKPLTFEQ